MNNQFGMMFQNMMRQAMPNPQMMVQQILQQNPQFAQAIRGQNVQQMAQNALQQNGININDFMPPNMRR